LNKEQLVEKLAARTGMTKRDAMDTLLALIPLALLLI